MTSQERFTRHWTKTQPIVAGYLASLIPNLNDAEDILQDVSVVLLNKFHEFDEQKSFTAWALGIARKEVLAARRSHARSFICRNNDLVEKVTATYDELAPELSRRTDALRHCMERVEARSRDVLRLRYEESRKPAEIAAALGLAAGTVRVLLSRVRASLHRCIEQRLASEGRRA